MYRNTAGQAVSAIMILTATGAPVTSGVTVQVKKDLADYVAAAGAPTYDSAVGAWEYAPTKAETDADKLGFLFVATGALNQLVQENTIDPRLYGIKEWRGQSTGVGAASISLASGTTAVPGDIVAIRSGASQQASSIESMAGLVATVNPQWSPALSGTPLYDIFVGTRAPGGALAPEVSVARFNGDAAAAARTALSTRSIVRGVVAAGATLLSIPTSSLDPAAVLTDQFKNKWLTFDFDTTTTGLRSAAAKVIGSTSAGILTLAAGSIPAAPVTGDKFSLS